MLHKMVWIKVLKNKHALYFCYTHTLLYHFVIYELITCWNASLTSASLCLQFPAQTTAATDEQKVFGLWETGEEFDTVNYFTGL